MKASFAAAALAAVAAAVPVEKRATYTDADILNYALTLEHLESTFYQGVLAQYSAADFEKAGISSHFYGNLMEISSDEKTHVSFLTSALTAAGAKAVAACSYSFGVTSPAVAIAVASILEGVGVSAYLGAAQYIANKNYLTAAGSILTVEARHSSYLRYNQLPAQSPFPAPFDIPLDLDQVYTLAGGFITSCPSSNPPLPVKAFPALTLGKIEVPVRPGNVLPITSASSISASTVYAYFMSVTGPISATVKKNSDTSFSVTVPSSAPGGQSYLILTNSASAPTDDNTVAGPAIIPVQSAYTYGWDGYNAGN